MCSGEISNAEKSNDLKYDSESPSSDSENNSDDLASDADSETDGFVEHSYEVLFVPDADIEQVDIALRQHAEI